MTRTYLSFLFIQLYVLSPLLSVAQNPSGLQIDWADEVKLRMPGYTEIAGVDDEYIYLYNHSISGGLSNPNWEFVVLHRSSLDVAWKYQGEPRTIEGRPTEIVHVECIDGIFRIILSHLSLETGGMKLHLSEVTENGMADGYLPLAHYPFEYGEDAQRWMSRTDDNSRAFDFTFRSIYQKGTDSLLEVQRYDEEYEITRLDIPLHHDLDHTRLLSLLKTENGESLIAVAYADEDEASRSIGIFKYDHSGVIDLQRVDLPESRWSNYWFNSRNGNLELGILSVSDDGSMSTTINVIDTDDLTTIASHSAQVPTILLERMKERWNSNDPADTPFRIANILDMNDGGSLITLQIQLDNYRGDRDAMDLFSLNDPQLYYDHYLKDLLFIKVTASSQIQWFSHIPLDQQVVGFPWSTGATFFSDNERQYILVNDDSDNIKDWNKTFHRIEFQGTYSVRNGSIVLISIENDGTVYYEHIDGSSDDEGFTFGPNVSVGTENGEAFLLRYNGNKRVQKLILRQP